MSSVTEKEADETANMMFAEIDAVVELQKPSTTVWSIGDEAAVDFITYKLIGCPPVPKANYILTRVSKAGRVVVLEVGRVEDRATTVNLAHIRHSGAKLGAQHVHLHVPRGGLRSRRRIERQAKAAAETGRLTGRAA